MTLPPRHPLDPHLSVLRRDLEQLLDALRWAHTDAYWPTRGGIDKPRGPSLEHPIESPDPNPDIVPAARFALGIGDDRTRRALADAVGRLGRIELHLAAAVMMTGTESKQPPLCTPKPASPLPVLEKTIASCSGRLEVVDLAAATIQAAERALVRRQLRAAAGDSGHAVRALDAALGRGSTEGIAHREPLCRICEIRPQSQREHQVRQANGSRATVTRASKGGRCDTCSQYFSRNGNERPRTLDQDNVDDALAAARRRAARGEGWGAA